MNNDYIQMKEIGIRLKEERLKIGLDQDSPSALGGRTLRVTMKTACESLAAII